MKTAIMTVFSICEWTLYIISIFAAVGMLQGKIGVFLGISVCVGFWMFARLFRIASFETEKLQNNDMLISIFSGVVSFAVVVIAIAAIVIDKIQ